MRSLVALESGITSINFNTVQTSAINNCFFAGERLHINLYVENDGWGVLVGIIQCKGLQLTFEVGFTDIISIEHRYILQFRIEILSFDSFKEKLLQVLVPSPLSTNVLLAIVETKLDQRY